MTTALIGKVGATAVTARVALVTRRGTPNWATCILRGGHEFHEFADWSSLAAACDQALDLVFFDDEMATTLPQDLEVPAVLVTDRPEAATRGTYGAVASTSIESAVEPLLALAADLHAAVSRTRALESIAEGVRSGNALVGRSPVMRRLQGTISRAADCDATVLIEGPPGSGKSLAARIVHCKSRRSPSPVRTVDCATLDADRTSAALLAARGTTLVFEDVDRLPAAAQSVLVRHLKERSAARNDQPRIIATTAAHLPELVARGAFREDLYYRLHAFPMVMPALRERCEDVAAIAEAVLATGAAPSGRTAPCLTPAAIAQLEATSWPGNVAQLEAVVRRAQAMAGGAPIDREHLVVQTTVAAGVSPTQASANRDGHDPDEQVTEDSIRPFEEEEQHMLTRALRATRGNVRRAAQLLRIGRATLYRKIQQYKLRLQ